MIKYLLTLIMVLFLNACVEEKDIKPSGNVVKVGVLVPVSAIEKRLGKQSLLGVLAANKMNKYLRNGDEIVFEIVNVKADAQSVKEALSELLSRDVKLIVSFLSSTQMLYIKEDLLKSKKPTIVTLATDSTLVRDDANIYQVCVDNSIQVLVASHYVKDEVFMKNVGIVYDRSSHYSLTIAQEFKEYFRAIDGEVKFFIDISNAKGIEEFKNIDKSDISLLFNTSNANLSIKTLKMIKTQKNDFRILGTDGLFSEALELHKKDFNLFNGVHVLEHFAHSTDKSDNRELLESILNKDGIKESSFAFLAYDGYQLLTNALEKCPGYNEMCIHDSLYNSSVIEGVAGNFILIDGKVKRAVYIDKIHNATLKKEVVID